MNGYNAVQAMFIPVSGVPLIDASSFSLMPDGRAQFNLTAGAGLATNVTVWGSNNTFAAGLAAAGHSASDQWRGGVHGLGGDQPGPLLPTVRALIAVRPPARRKLAAAGPMPL